MTPTEGGSRLVQTAFFEPKGLPGLAYWYVLYPVHGLIFRGSVRILAERATRAARRSGDAVRGLNAKRTRAAREREGGAGPFRPGDREEVGRPAREGTRGGAAFRDPDSATRA